MMVDYPQHLVRQRTVADGRVVVIRPMRRNDKCCAGKVRVDYDRRMAFVCEAKGDGGSEIVGEACYAANADGRSCDFELTLAEGWNKSGVAVLLLDALIRYAHARGFESMSGPVPPGNADVLRFMKGLGFDAAPASGADESVKVTKKI